MQAIDRHPTKGLRVSHQIALSLAMGVLGGVLVLADVPMKWKVAAIAAIGLAAFALAVSDSKRVLLGALAFTIPFHISRSVLNRPDHIGEFSSISIGITEVLVIGLLFQLFGRAAAGKERIQFFSSTTLPALIWLVVSAVSLVVAIDIEVSAIQMVVMLKLFLLYFVVANSAKDSRDAKWLVGGILLGATFQVLIGLYQGIAGHPLGLSFLGETEQLMQQRQGATVALRVQGTIGHPNGFAMYLATTMPFALALIISRVRPAYKVLAAIWCGFAATGLILSLSRGGWFSFGVAVVAILLLSARSRRMRMNRAAPITILMLSILTALITVQWDTIERRLTSPDQGAAVSRIELAKESLAIIRESPFQGVGLNNYLTFMRHYDWNSFQAWGRPLVVHNIYLLIAAESGIIGLAAFLWFLASLMVQAWRTLGRSEGDVLWVASAGTLAAFAVLAVHNMVDYSLLSSPVLFAQFWLLGGMAAGLAWNKGREKNEISARFTTEQESYPRRKRDMEMAAN